MLRCGMFTPAETDRLNALLAEALPSSPGDFIHECVVEGPLFFARTIDDDERDLLRRHYAEKYGIEMARPA